MVPLSSCDSSSFFLLTTSILVEKKTRKTNFWFSLWKRKVCQFLPSDLVLNSLCSRPPDRRRRDVFGVSNSTLFLEGGGRGNSTIGTGDNNTDSIPPIKEYPFSEGKSTVEFLEIPLLQPFTVYRIDLHACNEEVGHCSVGAFVYSRTKPAGSKPTWTCQGANYTCSSSSF